MANVDDEFSPGYDGPGTGANEWFVAPELCKGIMLKGAHTISLARHTPSTTVADAANGTILSSGGVWITYTTAGACGVKLLLQNTCATGEFATMRLRARAANTTVSGDGGSSIGTTTCIDASASANAAEYGNLKAVNAVAQPNALAQTVDATNIVTALYGRIDATAGSVGRRWVSWLDTHATTKAAAGDYMLRISHNGTVANDGAITIYGGGRLPVLFNFEDATPGFLDLGAKTITFKATDGNHTISFT